MAPGDSANLLEPSAPETGEDMGTILEDFERVVMPGITHWHPPRFFAYFPSNATPPTILADFLVSTMAVQCMLWQTSPAATEMETRMMEWLRQAIGLSGSFPGVIQDSASSATLAAVLTMRERSLRWDGNKTVYLSTQSCGSIVRVKPIVRLIGPHGWRASTVIISCM